MSDKLDFKKILPIFLIVLVDLMGLTIIIPLIPLYATSFGASAFLVGLLGASYPIMQFIGAPLLGNLSDQYGRRPVLIISQIGTVASLLLMGVANTLPLLFMARMLDGLTGGNISTAQAVITDSTNEKTRTQGLGLIGAAFGIGFTIGPVIAFVSLALSNNNYHVPAFVAAAFSLLALLLTTFWLDESLPAEKRGQSSSTRHGFSMGMIWDALQKPQVGILLVLIFAQQVAFGGLEQLLSLFTLTRLGLNASGNALLFVFIGVILVMVQGKFIGDWSRKYGERKLIYFGLAALTLGMLMTAITPRQPVNWYSKAELEAELNRDEHRDLPGETPPTRNIKIDLPDDDHKGWLGLGWLMVAMIPASLGGGVLQPSINSMITQNSPRHEIGSTLGVSAALVSGANAIAPVLGGGLFDQLGASAPFISGGLLLAGLFFLAVRSIKEKSST